MKTIYKYSIGGSLFHGMQAHISIPAGGQFLDIQEQAGEVEMWVLVDTDENTAMWDIEVYGTGHDIYSAENRHLKTIQQGAYVWHIFRTWT
jgi:hypothetical protein